jgi:hypothetical protein
MTAGDRQTPGSGGTPRLRDEGLTWRAVESEIVALDTRSSSYLSLNRSGALLWQRLVKGADRAALVRVLVEQAGCDPASAEADVDTFLRSLEELRLLAET